MKRILSVLIISIFTLSLLTAAAPMPDVTFTVLQGLPATMSVGQTATVIVQVDSDQVFNSAQARPSFYFPGRGVVALQGGDSAGRGTTAILEITFKAKGSTAGMIDGAAPVYVFVGARYGGGYTAMQKLTFNVAVP